MALDRTWYNSLVNDDGSGKTGTIWRKEDVGTLMNTVDQEIARLDFAINDNVVQEVSGISGIVNDLQLLPYTRLLILRNTLPLTITGLQGGTPGQTVTIIAASYGPVFLTFLDPRSLTPNWLGNTVSSGPTPLAPFFGRAEFVYDTQPDGVFWRMVNHTQGQSLPIPFDMANFTTNGGVWTVLGGSVGDLAYNVVGKSLALSLWIKSDGGSSIAAPAPTVLQVNLPYGYTLTRQQRSPSVVYADSGGQGVAILATIPTAQSILLIRDFAQTIPWPVGYLGFIVTAFVEIN